MVLQIKLSSISILITDIQNNNIPTNTNNSEEDGTETVSMSTNGSVHIPPPSVDCC